MDFSSLNNFANILKIFLYLLGFTKLSIGGVPLPGKPGTFLRKNFQGCVENLYYNGVNIIDLAKRKKPQIYSVVSDFIPAYFPVLFPVEWNSCFAASSCFVRDEYQRCDCRGSNNRRKFLRSCYYCRCLIRRECVIRGASNATCR